MRGALSQGVRTFCLIFGTLETLLAALWCAAGAGIYGSPLGGVSGRELAYVWAILLTGPLSALPATIVHLWWPRWGTAWLILGAIASGALAIAFLPPRFVDSCVAAIALGSLPMLMVGLWLLWKSTAAKDLGAGGRFPIERPEPRTALCEIGSILWGVALFLIGLVGTLVAVVGTYAALITLPMNVVTHQDAYRADRIFILLVFVAVGSISLVRKRLHLRTEFLAGMWGASALAGLFLEFRK